MSHRCTRSTGLKSRHSLPNTTRQRITHRNASKSARDAILTVRDPHTCWVLPRSIRARSSPDRRAIIVRARVPVRTRQAQSATTDTLLALITAHAGAHIAITRAAFGVECAGEKVAFVSCFGCERWERGHDGGEMDEEERESERHG